MPRNRKDNTKIFCSSVNSDLMEIPDFNISNESTTPIPKAVPKKKAPQGKSEVHVHKKNVDPQDAYTKYVRAIYETTILNDQFLQEKAEREVFYTSLFKKLEVQINTLEKASKRLKDILNCCEKEALLKSHTCRIEEVLSSLQDSRLENLENITKKLNTIRHIVQTRGIKVPQNLSEISKINEIQDIISGHLRAIGDAVRPYADSYSEAGSLLNSIIESQEIIANDVQAALALKSDVQENLLLHCSKEKSKLSRNKLAKEEEDNEILRIQKQFSKELMEQNGVK